MMPDSRSTVYPSMSSVRNAQPGDHCSSPTQHFINVHTRSIAIISHSRMAEEGAAGWREASSTSTSRVAAICFQKCSPRVRCS